MVAHVTLVTEQLRRPVPGGIGTYVRGLQQGLAALDDHDVVVEPWMSRLPPQLRSRLWDRGIGRLRADVVHAPSFAFPRVSGRLVAVVHDLAWRDAPHTFTARGVRWHERSLTRVRRDADRVVVPSDLTAERAVAAGVGADRVTVIEEGCDHLPTPDIDAAARVVAGEFILTVGTREPRKNLARLVEAFRLAQPRFPEPWPLVVVGPQGWGPAGQLDGTVATGLLDAAVLAGLYQRARAFVYVPLIEGFGLPPVEAMHAGVPVVTSNRVPSAGGATLAVEPTDVTAIANALVAAATDDAVRADLMQRGAVRAAQLTWKAAAKQHVDLWKSLLV